MVLPVGVTRLGEFKGVKGDAGTFVDAHGIPVAADEPDLKPILSGPESAREITFKLPRGLPGVNAVESDAAIAVYLGAVDSDSRAALNAAVQSQTFVVDTDFATLEDAFAATATGGTLEIRSTRERATTFTVDRAALIRFAQGGEIVTTDPAIAAITVASSGVAIEEPRLTGTGGTTAGEGIGILALGATGNALANIRVQGGYISGFSHDGILFEYVDDFSINGVTVESCAYSGIMGISVTNGTIEANIVRNIIQPTGFVNSYGIAATRRFTSGMSVMPRSKDIVIRGNLIDGVPGWEGLDTHAGDNITFADNTVYNCRVGIAVVGSKGEAGGTATVYAPLNCSVVNNLIDSRQTDGSASSGIQFIGAADVAGSPTELATGGLVSGNSIYNHGLEVQNGSALQAYGTKNLVISDNYIRNAGYMGIDLYYNNHETLVTGNRIIDTWSNSAGTCLGINIRSGYNDGILSNNSLGTAGKIATRVNERGLNVSASAGVAITDGGGNRWETASVIGVVGGATNYVTRSYGGLTGFYGVTPVARKAVIASPTADVASLKTAVDALRVALKDIGITL